jgi:hypothetical protein
VNRPTREFAGQAAVALDDLICHPNAGPLVAALRALTPVDLLDQGDAASDEVAAGFQRVADLGLMAHHEALPASEHPTWVRLGALSAVTVWVAGHGSTCMHSPRPERPRPIAAAAWRPGLVTCGQCTHLFNIKDAAKDATCDGCGRVTTGTANNDGIWPSLVQVGFLTWTFGACKDCKYWRDKAAS